jgi:hypothetical protein
MSGRFDTLRKLIAEKRYVCAAYVLLTPGVPIYSFETTVTASSSYTGGMAEEVSEYLNNTDRNKVLGVEDDFCGFVLVLVEFSLETNYADGDDGVHFEVAAIEVAERVAENG